MLIISLKRFIISFLLILVSTGIVIYVSMVSQSGEALQLRIDTQNIFFWGIIAFLLQIFIGSSLIFSHRNMVNNLKKITKIGDISHRHSQKILSKLGSIGKEIETLMSEQNKLVVMRSNRISALNSLVRFLCEGFTNPVIITDVRGSILSLSDSFLESTKKENRDISLDKLSDIRPDINLHDVLSHLEMQHLPWTSEEIKGIICTPIFDKTNKLNFCLWEFDAQHLNKSFREKQNIPAQRNPFERAQDLINKMSRKKK